MKTAADALHDAEAALEKVRASESVSKRAPVGRLPSGKPPAVEPDASGSVYLGHIGELAVKGKDY